MTSPSEMAKTLKSVLADIQAVQEYLQPLSDVVDGDYGQPEANREMRLCQDLTSSENYLTGLIKELDNG